MPKKKESHLDVLDEFIAEFKRTGCPPPLSELQRISDSGRHIRKAMKKALNGGYAMQPYRGCYLPLKDSRGFPVRVEVIIEDPDRAEETPKESQAAVVATLKGFEEILSSLKEEILESLPARGGEDLGEQIDEHLKDRLGEFEGNVEFRFETVESKLKKLIETVRGLNMVPENVRNLKEDVEMLKETASEVSTLRDEMDANNAWRTKMANIFSTD